jgi:hypothetical protein
LGFALRLLGDTEGGYAPVPEVECMQERAYKNTLATLTGKTPSFIERGVLFL